MGQHGMRSGSGRSLAVSLSLYVTGNGSACRQFTREQPKNQTASKNKAAASNSKPAAIVVLPRERARLFEIFVRSFSLDKGAAPLIAVRPHTLRCIRAKMGMHRNS
jgi:hypothetical protein